MVEVVEVVEAAVVEVVEVVLLIVAVASSVHSPIVYIGIIISLALPPSIARPI